MQKNKVIAGDYYNYKVSAKSGVARGLAGKMLLGNVGAMAGVYSAKDKGIYQIAIEFKNGKRSLIEVDDKIYKLIIKNCFACGSDSDEETELEQPKTENTSEPEPKKIKEVPEQSNTNDVELPKKPKKMQYSAIIKHRKTALSLDFYSNNAVLFETESEGFEPNKAIKDS